MAKRIEQVLVESVRPVAERLERIYSLQSILSAGILVLDRLSPEEREKAIAEANGLKPEKAPKKSWRETIEGIKQLTIAEKEQPGTIIKVLSKEDQARLAEFRKLIGPEPKKQKKPKQA